jgi:hypothetical protein
MQCLEYCDAGQVIHIRSSGYINNNVLPSSCLNTQLGFMVQPFNSNKWRSQDAITDINLMEMESRNMEKFPRTSPESVACQLGLDTYKSLVLR